VTARSPVGRLAEALRTRAPWIYQPVRRAYALVEYVRWRAIGSRRGVDGAFGDAFWDLHADGAWDWPGFAGCILRYTGPRAVVDIGCGDAKLLAAIHALAPAINVRGYDGSLVARTRAAGHGVEVAPVDLDRLGGAELARLVAECRAFDTALCLEVAEHLLPWHAGRLLTVLAACPTVVFSAAPPGQGGTLHMNERPGAYWVRRFAALGYDLSARDPQFRADLATLSLPPWYARNTHVFDRRPGQ
jgi:SAM-dependent methyltransferase